MESKEEIFTLLLTAIVPVLCLTLVIHHDSFRQGFGAGVAVGALSGWAFSIAINSETVTNL